MKKEGKTNKRKERKGKKEGGGGALQVFFCFSFNTGKGNNIDVFGPKVVGLLTFMTRLASQNRSILPQSPGSPFPPNIQYTLSGLMTITMMPLRAVPAESITEFIKQLT